MSETPVDLCSKDELAREIKHRDAEIERLQAKNEKLTDKLAVEGIKVKTLNTQAEKIERLRGIIDRERDIIIMYGSAKSRKALKEKRDGE